jgi:hypothetical protein
MLKNMLEFHTKHFQSQRPTLTSILSCTLPESMLYIKIIFKALCVCVCVTNTLQYNCSITVCVKLWTLKKSKTLVFSFVQHRISSWKGHFMPNTIISIPGSWKWYFNIYSIIATYVKLWTSKVQTPQILGASFVQAWCVHQNNDWCH